MNDLRDRTALITGATAGIGFHTAIGLAARGARVFITGRDEARCRAAVMEMQRLSRADDVDYFVCDASSVSDMYWLADQMTRHFDSLEILINNAGAVFAERAETAERLERTLALNFVAPFALTTRLTPLLTRARAPRVVNIVSRAFEMWRRDPFEDVHSRRRYVGIEVYGHAKLLNVLFTLALARRLYGRSVVVHAVNPGMAWTTGAAALTPRAVPRWRWVWPIVRWMQRRASPEAAARGPIFAAAWPDSSAILARYLDGVKERPLPKRLLDLMAQDRAWALGESLVARALASAALTLAIAPSHRRSAVARSRWPCGCRLLRD